eukprot:TRINITY_DN12487_c0_g1_i1.p1 TRINITY_DN12487_c0_g1~~TRINITY_DN12487_c0_g1_i1.p1  ORF type:complete len:225 (-),score=52.78 TRINITY_DN12487_c0_g1_i1:169-843(-)
MNNNLVSLSNGELRVPCLLCGYGVPMLDLRPHLRSFHNVTEPGIVDLLLLSGDDSKEERLLRKYRCTTCGFTSPEEAFVLSPHRGHLSGTFVSETLELVPRLQRLSIVKSPLRRQRIYECGEQVFAKMRFSPWWPAILLPPPGRFQDLSSHYDPAKRRYHVGYFSDKVMLRGWVPQEHIRPYNMPYDHSKIRNRDLTAAMLWANECKNWTNERRRTQFCFTRFA